MQLLKLLTCSLVLLTFATAGSSKKKKPAAKKPAASPSVASTATTSAAVKPATTPAPVASTPEPVAPEITEPSQAEHDAATRIQAAFRGYKAREEAKALKAEADRLAAIEAERVRVEQERNEAATRIQMAVKGIQARKQLQALREAKIEADRRAAIEADRAKEERRAKNLAAFNNLPAFNNMSGTPSAYFDAANDKVKAEIDPKERETSGLNLENLADMPSAETLAEARAGFEQRPNFEKLLEEQQAAWRGQYARDHPEDRSFAQRIPLFGRLFTSNDELELRKLEAAEAEDKAQAEAEAKAQAEAEAKAQAEKAEADAQAEAAQAEAEAQPE